MRKKLYIILLILAALFLFSACRDENTSDLSLWQTFDEDGRETAQLVLTDDQAKLYYYTFYQPNSEVPAILEHANLAEFSLQQDGEKIYGKSNNNHIADCSLTINGDTLTITWLESDEKYIPPISDSFSRVEEKNVEKALASRPFYAEDLVFPFDTRISVEDFIDLYGKPLDITYLYSADELYDEENPDGEMLQEITLYYDGATVRFAYVLQRNYNLIYNLEASAEKFSPTLRGMSVLGMHYKDIIQSFRLEQDLADYKLDYAKDVDENNLPTAYVQIPSYSPVYYLSLYGRETYLHSYGIIRDGVIFYNNENINLQLYFTDEKVSGFSYYESEFY